MQSHVRMIWIGFLSYYVFAALMAVAMRFASSAVLVLATIPLLALVFVRYYEQREMVTYLASYHAEEWCSISGYVRGSFSMMLLAFSNDLDNDKDYFTAKNNVRHVCYALFTALFILIVTAIFAIGAARYGS